MTKTSNEYNPDNFKQVSVSPGLLRKFMHPDGALRDIFVDNTSVKDWENLLDIGNNSDFSIHYFVDEMETDLPVNAATFFTNGEQTKKLQFKNESVVVNSRLFNFDQMEFDIDPRDFVAEVQHALLFDFLNLLSETTGKVVKLCDENSAHTPFMIMLPDKRVYVSTERF